MKDNPHLGRYTAPDSAAALPVGDYTPLPWSYRAASDIEDGIIIGGAQSNAALVPGYNDHPHNIANAALIVTAVNSHHALIAENKACHQRIDELEKALRPFVEYADAKGGSPKASDLREVICKIMESAPYPADLNAINQFCTAVLAAREALAPPQTKVGDNLTGASTSEPGNGPPTPSAPQSDEVKP